jgi:isochorismate hydrolase
MTNLCCETTVRSAFVHGFECFFTVDGTAAPSERFHVSTLLNLSYGFAVPVLVEELVKKTGDQF